MSITKYAARVVHLGGQGTEVGVHAVSEAMTPGHLVEIFDSGAGVPKYRKHTTAAGKGSPMFILDRPELNHTFDIPYAQSDEGKALIGWPGATFNAFIASGQNIAVGAFLESAGNGTLKAYTAGLLHFIATESVNNSAGPGDARIKIECL
jgi:hypothetical protein